MALCQVLNLTIIYIVIVAVTSRAWAASQHASDSLGYSAYGHGDSHCCWIISASLSRPIDRRLFSLPRQQALFLQSAAYTERSRLLTLLLLLAGDVELNPGPRLLPCRYLCLQAVCYAPPLHGLLLLLLLLWQLLRLLQLHLSGRRASNVLVLVERLAGLLYRHLLDFRQQLGHRAHIHTGLHDKGQTHGPIRVGLYG